MEKYEIVKEFEFSFEKVDIKIKAKILKNIDTSISPNYLFSWEISHYCSIDGEASPYIPSSRFGKTIEDAGRAIDKYVKRFVSHSLIEVNKYY